MFGSSPTKKDISEQIAEPSEDLKSSSGTNIPSDPKIEPASEQLSRSPGSPMGRKSTDEGSPNAEKSGEKRSRRISGVERAKGMFTSAKNSFISSSPTRSPSNKEPQTPMQKLGETDPVLGVPQGSLNNAAGESTPGPRSTFRVGVTEDKNKKCRRTMEDTHAYLYNFLSTPAPALDDVELQPTASNSDAASIQSNVSGKPIVETDNGYFAVFDGHAGSFAAEWCGKKLHILLEENIKKNPNTPIPELLDLTFTSVDQQLEKLPLKNSGCTAVVAVLRWEDRVPTSTSATGSSAIAPAVMKASASLSAEMSNDPNSRKSPANSSEVVKSRQGSTAVEKELRASAMRQRVLYTANVGDARIVLCRNGKALRLSYDHKGSDEHEGKRIANAGGLVLNNRVNGVLAVTRALGDAYMKDLVTGHPYTTETVIQPDIDEFLILACDGLWDVCTDQDAVDFVRSTQDPLLASKQLVDHALARFSTDNLSCMVVRFNSKAVQDTVEHRIDPIGVEGDPTVKDGISETTAIVHASARRLSEASSGPSSRTHSISHPQLHSHSQSHAPSQGTELTRIPSADEGLIPGMSSDQEPGPELNIDVLKEAQEKAKEGQKAFEQGGMRF